MSIPSAFFIVGAPRSGTSLMRDLIRMLNGVYLPPDEIQLIPAFAARLAAGASPRALAKFLNRSAFAIHMRRRGLWPDTETLHSLLAPGGASALQAIVLRLAETEGVKSPAWWGDKTPENIFHLDVILGLWPSARVLQVRRDPRDTVLSMNRAWGRSLLRGAVTWRDAERKGAAAQSALGSGRYRVISYEALTADPPVTLASIADWLGVHLLPNQLENYRSEERWGSASGKDGVVSCAGRWRSTLTARQLYNIEAIVFHEMVAAGYEPVLAGNAVSPHSAKIRFLRCADAARRLYAYSRERGFRSALAYQLRQQAAKW